MKNKRKIIGISQYFLKTTLAFYALGAILVFNTSNAQTCPVNGAATANFTDLTKVILGSLTHTSNCSSVGDPPSSTVSVFNTYTASVAAPTLIAGASYPLSITLDNCDVFSSYYSYVYVWIDFDNNGAFSVTEKVFDSGIIVRTSPSVTASPASGFITIPALSASVTSGNTRMRVIAVDGVSPLGNSCSFYNSGETEEYNVFIGSATPCSGLPASNTVVANSPTTCPNCGISLSFANTYTNSGLSYQWYSSTNSVGPFTAVAGATDAVLSIPNLTTTTWFQAIATCSISSQTTTVTTTQVSVAPTTTSSVPYFEGFEQVSSTPNQLPNCSWTRNTRAVGTATGNGTYAVGSPITGNGFAYYYAYNCGLVPSNTGYMYSGGIQLYPGITYSASVWYGGTVDSVALMLGTSQNPSSLIVLDRDNNVPFNPLLFSGYDVLTNTFTVPNAGIYYLALRTSDDDGGSCSYDPAVYDDLSVTIPCQLPINNPVFTVNGPNYICEGQSANLSVSGVTSYSWDSGPSNTSYSPSPTVTTTYSVTGTNSLTGCSLTLAKQVEVKSLPSLSVNAQNDSVCSGSNILLIANGSANTYTWINTGTTAASISATPSASTIYTVSNTDAFGCVNSATQSVIVIPLPIITVAGNRTICLTGGTFTANSTSDPLNYQWSLNSFVIQSTTVNVNPQQNTTASVTGIDANGCIGTYTFALIVSPCTGIESILSNRLRNLLVYPNPTSGEFIIELQNGLSKTFELMDVTGRVLLSTNTIDDLVHLNINDLSNGIYQIKIKSNNAVEILKVIKQ